MANWKADYAADSYFEKNYQITRMAPRFSIVTPVYNPPAYAFEKCIESVYAQQCDDWEWCLVDDQSTEDWVRTRLNELQMQDQRIKIYLRSENGGIVAASNDALSLVSGEFVVLLDNDDELHPEALLDVSLTITADPLVDYIYTDEDKITPDGEHYDEFRKPKWSPERFLAENYCSHLSIIRTKLINDAGRFRKGFDGSQDFDLLLRIFERTSRIVHIPKVLYHWRAIPGSAAAARTEKPYAFITALKAVSEHLERRKIDAVVSDGSRHSVIQVTRRLKETPKVSIIIPTCGTRKSIFGVDTCLVVNAVESIERKSSYTNYEIIVIADSSTPREVLTQLKAASPSRMKIIDYDKPFNFSEKCNIGVVNSDAQFVVLLNDDTEVISSDWLEMMLGYMQETDVAMVGPLLLLEDGRVQSAGHSNTPVPDHFCKGIPGNHIGPFFMLKFARECSGVTGACALIRRSAYFEVGGLSQIFPLAFNDVDFAFKLLDRGYRIIWTPLAKLFHFETASRPAKVEQEEVDLIESRWRSRFNKDEYCRIQ